MSEKKGITRRNFIRDISFAAGGTLLASTAFSLIGCATEEPGEPDEQVEQGGTKYGCLWCEEAFSDRKTLELHIQAIHPGKGFGPVPVAIMLSSIDNQEQLKRRIDEIINRNFLASIKAGGEIDNIGADYIRELSQAGFDIASQVKVDPGMSYDDKFEQSQSMKQELELLLGTQTKSYGSTDEFMIDQDTDKILSELGGGYIHVSSARSKHPDQTLEPELVPGLTEDIAVAYCWQQSLGLYNRGSNLLTQDILAMSGLNCDDSAQKDLDGPQWAEFEKSLIDQRIKSGKPLTMTFHCNMDTKGETPTAQWFEAFLEILDYLQEKREAGKVQIMSLADLTNYYFPGT